MKNKAKAPQKVVFYQYLLERTETASMVAEATGIFQKNLTRYKRYYEKRGQLAQVWKAPCKVTGCKAWYLTTDPKKFPKKNQGDLFGGES